MIAVNQLLKDYFLDISQSGEYGEEDLDGLTLECVDMATIIPPEMCIDIDEDGEHMEDCVVADSAEWVLKLRATQPDDDGSVIEADIHYRLLATDIKFKNGNLHFDFSYNILTPRPMADDWEYTCIQAIESDLANSGSVIKDKVFMNFLDYLP